MKEAQEAEAQPAPLLAVVDKKKFVKIGFPGYKVSACLLAFLEAFLMAQSDSLCGSLTSNVGTAPSLEMKGWRSWSLFLVLFLFLYLCLFLQLMIVRVLLVDATTLDTSSKGN